MRTDRALAAPWRNQSIQFVREESARDGVSINAGPGQTKINGNPRETGIIEVKQDTLIFQIVKITPSLPKIRRMTGNETKPQSSELDNGLRNFIARTGQLRQDRAVAQERKTASTELMERGRGRGSLGRVREGGGLLS